MLKRIADQGYHTDEHDITKCHSFTSLFKCFAVKLKSNVCIEHRRHRIDFLFVPFFEELSVAVTKYEEEE